MGVKIELAQEGTRWACSIEGDSPEMVQAALEWVSKSPMYMTEIILHGKPGLNCNKESCRLINDQKEVLQCYNTQQNNSDSDLQD